MADQSLNLSEIYSQANDEVINGQGSPIQHSLEKILDELDKKHAPKITEKSPRSNEKRKLRVIQEQELAVFPPFHLPFPPKTDRLREKRSLLHVKSHHDDIRRPSIELNHKIEQSSPNTYGTLTDRLETRTSSTTLLPIVVHKRGGSHPLQNEYTNKTGHVRRVSNPDDFTALRSQARLPSITDRTAETNLLLVKKSSEPSQFNISAPRKSLLSTAFPNNLLLPTRVASLASPSKIDSPNVAPINKTYLYSVFFQNKQSNEDYFLNSPKSAGLPINKDYQIAKPGSFSVFRKIVESELERKF